MGSHMTVFFPKIEFRANIAKTANILCCFLPLCSRFHIYIQETGFYITFVSQKDKRVVHEEAMQRQYLVGSVKVKMDERKCISPLSLCNTAF
jgi:hypothetical protein